MSNNNIIGMPPDYYGSGSKWDDSDYGMSIDAMNVMQLHPMVSSYGDGDGDAKGLTLFHLKEDYDTYKKVIDKAGCTINPTLPLKIAFLNDVVPSESWSNNYQESSWESKINNMSMDSIREYRQLTGGRNLSGAMSEIAKKHLGDGGLFNTITGLTAGATGGVSKVAEGLTKMVGGELERVVSGNKVDFPLMWESSTYQPSYSFTIRLYDPGASDETYTKFIIDPLIMLIAFAVPLTESNYSYSFPFLVKTYCPGLFEIKAGFVSSLDIVKGGEANAIRWSQRPKMVDVKLTINELYNTMVGEFNEGGSDEYERPTLKSYFNSLRDKVGVERKVNFIDTDIENPNNNNTETPTGYSPNSIIFENVDQEDNSFSINFGSINKRIPDSNYLPTLNLPSHNYENKITNDAPDKSKIILDTNEKSSDVIKNLSDLFFDNPVTEIKTINNFLINNYKNFKNNKIKSDSFNTYIKNIRQNIELWNLRGLASTSIDNYSNVKNLKENIKNRKNKIRNRINELKDFYDNFYNTLINDKINFLDFIDEKTNSLDSLIPEEFVLSDISTFIFIDDTINYSYQIKNKLDIDITQENLNLVKNHLYSKISSFCSNFNNNNNINIQNNYLNNYFIGKDIKDFLNEKCIEKINEYNENIINILNNNTTVCENLYTAVDDINTNFLNYYNTIINQLDNLDYYLNEFYNYTSREEIFNFHTETVNSIYENILLSIKEQVNKYEQLEVNLNIEINKIDNMNQKINNFNKNITKNIINYTNNISIKLSLINQCIDIFRKIHQEYIFLNDSL
jgi:hypothetical protein